MTQITLQAYLTDIQKLLDDNRLTEAVAHCKYILHQHPRYIEAYRLLGKALLEQHEYVSAADIFQRILSADPEDFVAYVGLADVYRAEELMNEAIWHMERAYETQPYNASVQRELRDLYAWRDGELKTRELQLTPNALARLHFNAELYQQAVSELRTFLKTYPDRVDARTLLAEALWRGNQRVDAVDVCLQLLETLPNCIKANAILSEIWLMTGRIDEAQEYLQKLQALVLPTAATLNEDSPVGYAFGTEGAIPVPPQITIKKLDKVVEEEVVLSGVPDWVDELELSDSAFLESTFGSDESFRGSPLNVGRGDSSPDWLQALTTPSAAEQGGRESADVLDWLREVATGENDESLKMADDLPDMTPSALDSEAALPDWLSEVLDADTPVPPVNPSLAASSKTAAADAHPDDEAWLYNDATDAPPGLPDWMGETATDLELHAPPTQETLDSEALPDWLDDELISSPATTEQPDWFNRAAATSTPDDDQLSNWLDSLADTKTTQSGPSQQDDLPDWFSDMTAMDSTPSASEPDKTADSSLPGWLQESQSRQIPERQPAPQPPSDTNLPDWLSDLTEATPSDESSASSGLDLPDWLGGVTTTTPAPSPQAHQPGEPESAANDLPDWLSDLSHETVHDAAASDDAEPHLPDWLNTAADVDMTEPESFQEDTTLAAAETTLPAWFGGLAGDDDIDGPVAPAADLSDDWLTETKSTTQPAAAEPVEETELPDWLSHFASDLGEAEAPPEPLTNLSDWLMDEEEYGDAAADEPSPPSETALPDWLNLLPTPEESATDDAIAEDVFEVGLADWLDAMPEPTEAETTLETEVPVPDWLTQDLQEEEAVPLERPAEAQEDESVTPLPDWLKELNALDDSDDTAQKKSEFLEAEAFETPSSLAEFSSDAFNESAPERETPIMSDSPQKNPQDKKAQKSPGDLEWLDELANLPLDEPSTIPSSESNLKTPPDSDEESNLDEADMAWLDALHPADATADQTLDWLDQMDQPEVEEAPTLSWLSEEDLRGQATGAYNTGESEDGEDLEEAMSWLESLVTDSTTPAPDDATSLTTPSTDLHWLEELDDLRAGEEEMADTGPTTAEEMPTMMEAVPSMAEEMDPLDDLFSLSEDEAPEDMAAAMSWLDELAQADTGPDVTSDALFHAGLPPEDPEAAMAWLEQLAAAQTDDPDDEFDAAPELPALTWGSTSEEPVAAAGETFDWLDELAQSDEDLLMTDDLLDLGLEDGQAATWSETVDDLTAETFIQVEPAGEALPNWLDELAELPGDELAADDTVAATPDWIDTFAAATPDDAFPLDMPEGDALPSWLDELTETPVDAPLRDAADTFDQAETVEPERPTPPTYVPPTNISAEAAKILDMSDLFDLDDVEESEEDMAQAMAWMNELLGDTGLSDVAPVAELPIEEPVTETPIEIFVSELEVEVVASEAAAPEPVTEQPAAPTYVPPTNISAEAAKILDMSDLFDMDDVEESEEDMAQAMAWMAELMGDMGTTTPTPAPEATAPEPTPEPEVVELEPLAQVEEPVVEADSSMDWLNALIEVEPESAPVAAAAADVVGDEAMAWLDEIVAEIGDAPVAAASPAISERDDEAMAWLDEIVAEIDHADAAAPEAELPTAAPLIVEESPTEPALAQTPEPQAETVVAKPIAAPDSPARYIPPTDISPEAAKILDMSDLFDLGNVEESEEDMAQAMAWMAELMGDMGTTTSSPAAVEPEREPESPETVISATPVIEEDSAVDWLDELASQDTPFSALPDLDKPFTVDDQFPEAPTETEAASALDWLNQLSAEQESGLDQPQPDAAASDVDDSLFMELTNIPEDPDAAMDWLEQLSAQQLTSEEPSLVSKTKTPVVEEPRTPAVPPEVMDALAKVETKREKAKTGPLKPPPDFFGERKVTPEKREEETPFSLIKELTAGDVAESLPDWLSLDVIDEENSTLSWLSEKDLDATGWLESEAAMVDQTPEAADLPFVTPVEPVRDEPAPWRESESTLTVPPVEPLNFEVNLDMGADDGTFAAARQLLNTRQYDNAIRSYTNLLETSPAISPVITELEGAVDTHPAQPLLRRLLGDAYMRNGQLQKALETYRKALDQL